MAKGLVHLGSDGKGQDEVNFSCNTMLCRARLTTAQQLDESLVKRAQNLNAQRMRRRKGQVTHAD